MAKMEYPAIYYIAGVCYPVLAAVGVPVNLMAIVILSRGKCGLSKCITRYLVGMAVADLMVVIVAVLLEQINSIYIYARFLLFTPICAVTVVLRFGAVDSSVWLTVAFMFDRCIAICCEKLRERYCTERMTTIVTVIIAIGSSARCIPFYFSVESYVIIDNLPWQCVGSPEYFSSPVWTAYQVFNSAMTPLLPIGLILLFNALTVQHIIAANKVRQGLRNRNKNQKDSEVENRRKSMVLLFALSANFIILWMPYVIYTTNWRGQNFFYTNRYLSNPLYIAQQFGFMFQSMSTCTNPCIYTLSQKKIRQELKNGTKYLLKLSRRIFG